MAVDHQVQGGAVQEGAGLFDRGVACALEHPHISVMHHIFGHLTVAQLGVEETHQLAIVVFQHDSWPHGLGTNNACPAVGASLLAKKPKSASPYLDALAIIDGFAITDDGSLSVCNL